MMEEKEAANKETDVSGGYRNEEATTETDIDACKSKCDDIYLYGQGEGDTEGYQTCLNNCESLPGIAIQTQIKNWGSDINKMMTNALGADMQRLINADEITELLGVIYSALMNKAMNGLGLAFSALTSNKLEKARNETKSTYSYQRIFKKEQTAEDVKDVQSETLTNILKAMQQLSRSITTCKDDELMKYDDYTKNLADIFSGSVEALYIGLDGVNLKPDFEVLDPRFIPDSRFAPYTVYGYSWGQVPAAKFPDKCKAITDQLALGDNATCRNIKSGLEPNIQSQCETCMYDHDSLNCPPAPYPPQPYPKTGQEPWIETVLKQKSDYWWGCKNQYNVTLGRCDECLKNVDDKCQQVDAAQKNQCIINQCGNFSDISNNIVIPLPTDPDSAALEFYNRCTKEEKKDACYTCLKEYFMPATYCDQTRDYMARSLIKYPALVKKVRNNAPDHEIWIGPYDEIMGEQGGDACDNNDEAESIDLAIICRILPDFKYDGEKVCETRCSQSGLTGQALTNALKDISDFRPNGKDCGNLKLAIGGKETWAPVNDGAFQIRGKCCGALWQHDAEKYAVCVGRGTTTKSEGLCKGAGKWWLRPECWCEEGERSLGETSTSRKPLFDCPYDEGCWGATDYQDSPTCRTGCASYAFKVPNMFGVKNFQVKTNPAPGGSVILISTITAGTCEDSDQSSCTAEGASFDTCDYVGQEPATSICRVEAHKSSGAEACIDKPARTGRGPVTLTCDLSSHIGDILYLSVVSNDTTDCKTTASICVTCDPSDPGYPDYGYKDGDGNPIDQCNNKIPSELR